jgi:hypothetical protein
MWTAQSYIDAYLGARRARIAIEAMGTVERAGKHLLGSAVRTEDGLPSPVKAMSSALSVGEIDAALEIHEGLMATTNDLDLSWGGMGRSVSVSGEIESWKTSPRSGD